MYKPNAKPNVQARYAKPNIQSHIFKAKCAKPKFNIYKYERLKPLMICICNIYI